MDLSAFRQEYSSKGLRRADLQPDPVSQFGTWFSQAVQVGLHEPNAMTLATVRPDGVPAQRIVLLKSFDAAGFIFFTNYLSAKGRQLEAHPSACLLFPWYPLERQVIVTGTVEKTSDEESDHYFHVRPRESQFGAWVSQQSQPIDSREVLVSRLADLHREYGGRAIPRPPHWGGYRLVPSSIEFWQGGPARLHDRFIYERVPAGWSIQRLSP